MRSYSSWLVAIGLPLLLTAVRCGGSTSTGGNGNDASVDDGNGGSSSGADSGGSSGGSSGSSSGGSGSGSGSGSSSGGADAGCPMPCNNGHVCCGGVCVDKYDDPLNCGGCGLACPSSLPTCIGGNCAATPCDADAAACAGSQTCCGASCCNPGQICCVVDGPVVQGPQCVTPTSQQPSCPLGCSICP
ncbi:MAG TPA: hypothetical protein VF765_31735 [Polyangiaceae bacterium]